MDPQLAEELIARSRPRRSLARGSMMLLLGLSILLGAAWADPGLIAWNGAWGWILPQIILLSMIGLVLHGLIRQRRLTRLMQEAFEAVQLREYDRARTALMQLLQTPIRYDSARAEALLSLAAIARFDGDFATAQHIYERLLEENEGDAIQLQTARVGLAEALLRNGQLADAVTLIDRLERAAPPAPLRAQVELVMLLREILTGQSGDALPRSEERRKLFREYMGTAAAFGYALLSAAFDMARQEATAARYWSDATLLMHRDDLVRRYPELAGIADRYPATENPL